MCVSDASALPCGAAVLWAPVSQGPKGKMEVGWWAAGGVLYYFLP